MSPFGSDIPPRPVRYSSITSVVAPTAGFVLAVPASEKRVRLHFRTDGSNIVTVSPVNDFTALGSKIHIGTQMSELILDIRDYGTLIQSPWFAIAVGAGTPLDIIQVMQD